MRTQDVVVFPNDSYLASSDLLRASHPQPTIPIKLASDIWLDLLDHNIANQVMDACEPMGVWPVKRPVRQYGQLYAFVREPVPEGKIYEWDPDQKLRSCIALSRLIHPTSISLEYSARIFYADSGVVRQVCPGPVNGRVARTFMVRPRWRDWLIDGDLQQLSKLLSAPSWTALPERLRRALWHHEFASSLAELNIRWILISTALEALVHTDRQKSTKQFTTRVPLLAKEVGITEFSSADASMVYEYRSRLAHGQTLADPKKGTPAHVDATALPLYWLMERIVRAVLKKALTDPKYAAIFENDDTIRAYWPVDMS